MQSDHCTSRVSSTQDMTWFEATAEVPLRPNVVDPITRKNSGNVGDKVPIVDIELIDEDYEEFYNSIEEQKEIDAQGDE